MNGENKKRGDIPATDGIKMDNIRLIAGIAVVVIVAAFVAYSFFVKKNSGGLDNEKNNIFEETTTRRAVPEGTTVPGMNSEVNDPNIAKPEYVTSSGSGSSSDLRIFPTVKADKGIFAPSELIVREGDDVQFYLEAIDKDYDITIPDYGIKQTAKKGEKKILHFQAGTEGKFLFYCDSCGGVDSETKGYLVVVRK